MSRFPSLLSCQSTCSSPLAFPPPLPSSPPLFPCLLLAFLVLSNLLLLFLLLSRYTETLFFPSHHRLSIPSYLHYSTTLPHSPCLPSSPLVLHLSLLASRTPLSNIQLAWPFPSSPLLLGCELPNQGGREGSLAGPDGWSSALTRVPDRPAAWVFPPFPF